VRYVIAAVLSLTLLGAAPASAVECSPGLSRYPRRVSPALLPPYPNPPFRVFAGWGTEDPTYAVAGIREVDNAWYAEVTATTSGVTVHGEHRETDTGFQAGATSGGGVHVCAHGAGQTVEQRAGG